MHNRPRNTTNRVSWTSVELLPRLVILRIGKVYEIAGNASQN